MLGDHRFSLDYAQLPAICGTVGDLEVIEMPQPAANLFHRENLVNGGKRREQKELLPRLATQRSTEKQHGIDIPSALRFGVRLKYFSLTHV